ncbi:MAG: hypothetical protein OHK0046_41650 [Anaerolineae bacterium]
MGDLEKKGNNKCNFSNDIVMMIQFDPIKCGIRRNHISDYVDNRPNLNSSHTTLMKCISHFIKWSNKF